MDQFKNDKDESGNTDFGNVFLLSAVALFIVFAAFQTGMTAAVQNVASEFADKFDHLSIADSGRPNM